MLLGILGLSVSLLLLLGVVYLLFEALYTIRKFRYGVVERFGKRIKIVYEGLHVKIPFVDKVEIIKMKLYTIDIDASFTTKDNQRLEATGSLQIIPDPEIVELDEDGSPMPGRNIFDTVDEKTIKKGIDDAVSSLLGGLGGAHDGQNFINDRAAIYNILNDYLCTDKLASEEAGGPTEPGPILDWYKTHYSEVEERFRRKVKSSKSKFEIRYGIRIVTFELDNIDFDEKTKKTMEEVKQADYLDRKLAKQEAAARRILEQSAGKDPRLVQLAWDAVHMAMEPRTTKSEVSVQGESGVLGAVVSGFSQKRGDE